MKVLYDKDSNLSLIKNKKVAVIGYGSQGHAHALNLSESGVDVIVGVRKFGSSWSKVLSAGLNVMEVADAVREADIVMMLIPDETISSVFKTEVLPNIKDGSCLAFAHGFTIHYGQVVPSKNLDVIMIAPKAPGLSAELLAQTVARRWTCRGGDEVRKTPRTPRKCVLRFADACNNSAAPLAWIWILLYADDFLFLALDR